MFREYQNEHDSGVPSTSTDPVPIKPRIWFGHPLATTKVFECSTVHKRKILIQEKSHKCDQGGTVANKTQGCSSMVVSRQNPDYNEYDDFLQFTYSSNINQGAYGLYTSYTKSLPIRVFRTSGCSTFARPPPVTSTSNSGTSSSSTAATKTKRKTTTQSYRYDGLYVVKQVFDWKGNRVEALSFDMKDDQNNTIEKKKHIWTFLLCRLGTAGTHTGTSTSENKSESESKSRGDNDYSKKDNTRSSGSSSSSSSEVSCYNNQYTLEEVVKLFSNDSSLMMKKEDKKRRYKMAFELC